MALFAWLPPAPPLWCLASASAALALSVLASALSLPRATAAAAALFFVSLGGLRCLEAGGAQAALPFPAGEGDAVVTGRVAATPERREGSLVFDLHRARLRREGRTWEVRGVIQVFLDNPGEVYRSGAHLMVRGRLARVRGDRNYSWFPTPVDPGRRRLAGRLFVSSPFWIRHFGREGRPVPVRPVESLRERIVRFWDSRSSPAAPLLKALTTGQRSGLPQGAREDFQRSGLAHLLAVSGLHLGFLALFIYRLLRLTLASIEPLALRWAVQPLAAAATMPAMLLLYLLTGEQVSAGRAAVMAGLGLSGVIAARRPDLLNLVACAVLVMLFHDPLLLFSVSFQLSFSAAVFLVLAAPRIPRIPAGDGPVPWLRRGVHRAAGLVCVSALATLATSPLTAYHFHRISLAGPAANLIAVPLACVIVLPLAWLAALASPLGICAGAALAVPAETAGEILIAVANFFAGLPGSSIAVPAPPPLAVISLLAALALLTAATGEPGMRSVVPASLLALGMSVALWCAGPPRSVMRAAFLDVGQGEAAIVRLPGGRAMLIDTGPAREGWDAGRSIVAPALRREGVMRIDYLVISHLHPDHCGGLASILGEFPVGEIWIPSFGLAAAAPELHSLLDTWETEGGTLRRLRRGDRRDLAGRVSVHILNPPDDPYGRGGEHRNLNDNSLAFLLQWKDIRLLATGDIGTVPSLDIARLLGPPSGRAVLKVPHHGGRQGGTGVLAGALGDPLAVISVGRNNYGHPNPETLDVLGGEERVLRTDKDGGIFLESDGAGFEVRTWSRSSAGQRGWAGRLRWLLRGR